MRDEDRAMLARAVGAERLLGTVTGLSTGKGGPRHGHV